MANVVVNREKINQKRNEKKFEKRFDNKKTNHVTENKNNNDKKNFKKPENNNKPKQKVYRQDSGETYRPFELYFKKKQEENKTK